MSNALSFSRHGRQRRAFTLAELLIVIAIIAVLISVLLPALSAARRSAQTVKCLSSLRQLGSAFQQYAQENKRFFPVVRWQPGAAANASHPEWGPGVTAESTGPGANSTERIWVDMISKYILKTPTFGDYTIYGKYQQGSVFWGCPAFNTNIWEQALTDKRYSMSYGMSMYPLGPYGLPTTNSLYTPLTKGFGPNAISNAAYINLNSPPTWVPGGGKGQFFKMEQWGRHSQDKALLADSNGFDIIASPGWTKSDESSTTSAFTQPKVMGMDYPHQGAMPGSYISVDATRHISPTANKAKIIKQRGVNMLYVDGHASTVSPREAWIAAVGGGTDLTQ